MNLFTTQRASITAPAGCGKTELIVKTLNSHTDVKPILVLTHTNAGVGALQARLSRAGVASSRYRIATIDGWAMRLISKFPKRSGHHPDILKLNSPKTDYQSIRVSAMQLVQKGHINDALRATYSGVLVDEYQDCSTFQHAIIDWMAVVLPTCVFGDPMQAIFGFGGNQLVDWNEQVLTQFPSIGTLEIPWRWRNAGTEQLGQWLLETREKLRLGYSVDLKSAPQEVTWIQTSQTSEITQRLAAARTVAPDRNGNVLIIAESTKPQEQKLIASQTPGATAVESVELNDLKSFGNKFRLNNCDELDSLIQFDGQLMTNSNGNELLSRLITLQKGTARKPPSNVETSALAFKLKPSFDAAKTLLQEISQQKNVRVYRPELFRACLNALGTAGLSKCTFAQAIDDTRELARFSSRKLSKRAVGSTLLLKGLEADVVVILKAESMDAKHLYVAMTRGAKRVVICSPSSLLNPPQ